MDDEYKSEITCGVCGLKKEPGEVIPVEYVRKSIVDTIKKRFPDWKQTGYICTDDLNKFRSEYVQDVLEQEMGEISAVENEVLESLEGQDLLSRNINTVFSERLSFGERASDKLASFGGSWKFIILFGGFLLLWIIINSVTLLWHPMDPFPFIFLNLILSCVAALQAPVIMMSQNRVEAKDRLRSENDYKVNLKAELEIRHMSDKIDNLLRNQWRRLLEIQEIQLDIMGEMNRTKGSKT